MKRLLILFTVICVMFSSVSVYAAKPEGKTDIKKLNEKEIAKLLKSDENLADEYDKLSLEGYEIEDITISTLEVELDEKSISAFGIEKATSRSSYIVQVRDTTYRQPTKEAKDYYEDILNTVADFNSWVQVGAGLTKPYIWIPMTIFGFDTAFLSDILASGYVKTTEDRNYHSRTVWVYDSANSRYVLGAGADKASVVVSMLTNWTDSYGNPRHSYADPVNFTYTSSNYNNLTVLKYAAINSFENQTNPYREYYSESSLEYID